MSTQSERELPFSPEFTERVFDEAERVRRRRRAAGFGAIGAAGILSAVAAFLFALPALHTAPTVPAASMQPLRMDASVEAPTDPLQFLFPDAEPVAQFADDYSEMAYGRQRRPGELLFADDAEERDNNL